MAFDTFAAMVTFVFVMSATPGPNTMMLLASGVNHGVRRTVPHMLGVTFGFAAMMLAVGLGIGALFTAVPGLDQALKVASVVYMLWLAWRIASSGTVADDPATSTARPLSALQGAAFQWVNPKARAIALSGTASYASGANAGTALALMVAVIIILNVPITWAWTAFGAALRQWLRDPVRLRIFNVAMALALVASLWPVLAQLG